MARVAGGDSAKIRAALALIRQAGTIIKEDRFEGDEYQLFSNSLEVAKRRYRITKATVLIGAGWPQEALDAVDDVMDLPPMGDMARMNAFTNYLWAQAYADMGTLDAAAIPAQEALAVMKHLNSVVNIARIAGLQSQLALADPKHIEVIRLGVMLRE